MHSAQSVPGVYAWFFAKSSCIFQHTVKDFSRGLRNPMAFKTCPKNQQKLPKWGPGCSRDPPRETQNGSRGHFDAQIYACCFLNDKKKNRGIDFFGFWPIFGTRPGPENRPKPAPWPKRRPQRRCQKRFSCHCRFFSPFPSIRSQKWTKNQWKFERVFSVLRVFFPNPRKPNSMHRRSVLSSFHFFVFFVFLAKNMKKTSKKGISQKNAKNDARGTPQTPKIQQKPTRKNQKNQKIAKKKRFLRRPIFDEISTCKKTRKNPKKNRNYAGMASCAVPAGGKEGSITMDNPPGLCEKV